MENAVQSNQQQLVAQLQQIQTMMQSMQLIYADAPQPTYQDYGSHVTYIEYNYWGRGGCGAQLQGNCRVGCGGRASSDITYYFWKHGMCAHPVNYFRTPAEGYNNNVVWCNKIAGRERNSSWQDGSLTSSNSNVVENKTSFTSKLLYSSIIDPPKHATIIEKSDSIASNN